MISLGLLLVGGVSAFTLKWVSSRKKLEKALLKRCDKISNHISVQKFNEEKYDDIKEVKHSYRLSLYAIALISASSLFYRPILFLGLPVLGYGTFGFFTALKESPKKGIKSPLVIFETVSIVATVITQHLFLCQCCFFLAYCGAISY